MFKRVEKVQWNQVDEEVFRVNPGFAQAIRQLAPGADLPLYRVRYGFADSIYRHNQLQLGDELGTAAIQQDLSYRVIPIGLMLNRSAEIFTESQQRVIPLRVLQPGDIMGLWQAFEPQHSGYQHIPWQMQAGARSIFCLASLNDSFSLKRLYKKYKLRAVSLSHRRDQWYLFKHLLASTELANTWSCDVLYFSKAWFDYLLDDRAWIQLRHYCYQAMWQQTIGMRHQVSQNLIWQQFVSNVAAADLRCSAYQLQILKHLVQIGVGQAPGFQPMIDQHAAPLHLLQRVLVEDYDLHYLPTMMAAAQFDMNQLAQSSYYSLNEPTLIESVPRSRQINNIMQVAREIKQLLQYVYDQAASTALNVSSTLMQRLLGRVSFDIFHSEMDVNQQLVTTHVLPLQDSNLLYYRGEIANNDNFCYASSFLKGCVRLSITSSDCKDQAARVC